jgi:hypothetical protein
MVKDGHRRLHGGEEIWVGITKLRRLNDERGRSFEAI